MYIGKCFILNIKLVFMIVLDGRDEKESVNNIKKNLNVVRIYFDK